MLRSRDVGLVCFGGLIGAGGMVLLEAKDAPAGFAYFANCREAIQAGVAPIYYGQPGYRLPLDADGDGVACEPYRGP